MSVKCLAFNLLLIRAGYGSALRSFEKSSTKVTLVCLGEHTPI